MSQPACEAGLDVLLEHFIDTAVGFEVVVKPAAKYMKQSLGFLLEAMMQLHYAEKWFHYALSPLMPDYTLYDHYFMLV